MKRILAGIFATVMLGSGLLAFSETAATAGPYTGTVATSTKVRTPDRISKGGRARVCVRVTTVRSDTRAKGQVTVRVLHRRHGFTWAGSRAYKGGKECFRTKRLHKRGKYTVKVSFASKPNSMWRDSGASRGVRVTRRR